MTTSLAIAARAQHSEEDRTWPVSFFGKLAPDEDLVETSSLPSVTIEAVGVDDDEVTAEIVGIIEAAYTNGDGFLVPANKAVDVQVQGTSSGVTYKMRVRSRTTRNQTLVVVCQIDGKDDT